MDTCIRPTSSIVKHFQHLDIGGILLLVKRKKITLLPSKLATV